MIFVLLRRFTATFEESCLFWSLIVAVSFISSSVLASGFGAAAALGGRGAPFLFSLFWVLGVEIVVLLKQSGNKMWRFLRTNEWKGDEFVWKVRVVLILWVVWLGRSRGPSALVAAACEICWRSFFRCRGPKWETMCEVSQGGRLQFRYKFFAGSGLVSPGASFSNSRKVLPEVFSEVLCCSSCGRGSPS